MGKLTLTFNLMYISTIFFSSLLIQGMETFEPLALQSEKYDNDCFLIRLPSEILPSIQSLEDSIKFFMKLSITCEEYNELLTCENIGSYCKMYFQCDKNMTLQNVIEYMCPNYDYTSKRLTVLTLVCAGAKQSWEHGLLKRAVIKDDAPLVSMIFTYNTDLDANIVIANDMLLRHQNNAAELHKSELLTLRQDMPLLFAVKTVEIAKEFIAHGANVNTLNSYDQTNVLWNILNNKYPSNLMKFYLEQQVDAITPPTHYKESLLHRFAATPYEGNISGMDNFIQKAKLLLASIPNQINMLNKEQETPLDIVKHSLKTAKKRKKKAATLAFKVLTVLFQEHGAFMSEDLIRLAHFKWMKV